MATDTEVYRTANLLIETYGDMAVMGATIKADNCLEKGDSHGRAVWLRIADAVRELTAETPPHDAVIN